MHQVIQDGLEEYLSGFVRREFQAHLDQCLKCSQEVAEFSSFSHLIGSMSLEETEEVVQPNPGFYYRLSQTIEEQKTSPWNMFSLDAVFSRRIIFASLMMLAVLGGVLVSRESDLDADFSSPEVIMASHNVNSLHESGTDREQMMATLARYQH